MHDVARDWLVRSIPAWRHDADPSRPFRILSVGCGDGDLDVPMIVAAASIGPVDYVGCDVNDVSLHVFDERLDTAAIGVTTRLECVAFDDLPDEERFDLVLLSHMLYYVADPAGLIREALDRRCVVGGRVVAVHSAADGVPAMTEEALGFVPFTPAESIVVDSRSLGVSPKVHRLHTEFRFDDSLISSQIFADLVGFLVEREDLDDTQIDRVVEVMKARSNRIDDQWVMSEEVLALEITHRLARSGASRVVPVVDPIRDYHALEEAFEWSSILRSPGTRRSTVGRLLDVGCGTGRWLRVLAAADPTLADPDRTRFVYDRVDPVSEALEANALIAAALFDVGATWNEVVETAALPKSTYDVIWSVHSLYAVAPDRVAGVIDKLTASLAPGGVLVIALGARDSFYLDAKPTLTGTDRFLSSDDVVEAADLLGLAYRLRHVDYVERFDPDAYEAVRRFVWHESIGNTYLPAGLGVDLPDLPTGDWFDSFRTPSGFEFPQRTGVIVIEG
jgi:SAM-dependent methyltransferase